jgi:hypothetical protein
VGIMKELARIGWKIDMGGFSSSQNQLIPTLAEKSGISADGFYTSSQVPLVYEDSPIPTSARPCMDGPGSSRPPCSGKPQNRGASHPVSPVSALP